MPPKCSDFNYFQIKDARHSGLRLECCLDHGHEGPHKANLLPEFGGIVVVKWEPK